MFICRKSDEALDSAFMGPLGCRMKSSKVAADNLKAFRNAIRMCVPSIRLRKPGCAGLSTDGTPKIFSPTVEDDHPLSMTLRRDHSTPPVFFPTTGVWVVGQFDCQRNPA